MSTSDAADPPNPDTRAQAVRAAMYARDAAAQALGLEVTSIGPGQATVELSVRADMLNGFAICHGGLIATLADTAFAYACNSFGPTTVASGFSIDLVAPARLDDRLIAQARCRHQAGRTGLYDVEVVNQRGESIAYFRGRSHRVSDRTPAPAGGVVA